MDMIMIDNFKHYLAEQMSVNIAAGWITPHGEKINVPAFEHDNFVKTNKKKFDITEKELKTLPEEKLPKHLAIQKGAIRFHVFKVGYGHQATATIGATQNGFRRFKGMIEDIMIDNRINNYDLFLTDDDGEFLGMKAKSMFESVEDNIKLWLDDIRPMPPTFNTYVKTAKEAIKYLESDKVTEISFDHDLGEPENGTGYDVAKWIEEAAYYKKIKPIKWQVHSANPIGAKNIENAMRMAEQFWSHNEQKRRSNML